MYVQLPARCVQRERKGKLIKLNKLKCIYFPERQDDSSRVVLDISLAIHGYARTRVIHVCRKVYSTYEKVLWPSLHERDTVAGE